MPEQPVILYDGACGFCNHAVQFLLRVDRRGELRFAALQSDFAKGVLERHPELETMDTVVYVTGVGTTCEQVAVRSDGALRAISHADRPWRWLRVASVIPRPVRDCLYDGFAAIGVPRVRRTRSLPGSLCRDALEVSRPRTRSRSRGLRTSCYRDNQAVPISTAVPIRLPMTTASFTESAGNKGTISAGTISAATTTATADRSSDEGVCRAE